MITFAEKVHTFVQKIPKGKVATYGQLAKLAGNAHAARAVGNIMKNNPDMNTTPCHRVVASDGKLTGYAFGGIFAKKAKLKKEGVHFFGNRVDLTKSAWLC